MYLRLNGHRVAAQFVEPSKTRNEVNHSNAANRNRDTFHFHSPQNSQGFFIGLFMWWMLFGEDHVNIKNVLEEGSEIQPLQPSGP